MSLVTEPQVLLRWGEVNRYDLAVESLEHHRIQSRRGDLLRMLQLVQE